jgi:hypothetical protein
MVKQQRCSCENLEVTMSESKVCFGRRVQIDDSNADVHSEYVTQYASNVHHDDDEDGEESDGELSEVEDFKSDDDEPAGAMEDV